MGYAAKTRVPRRLWHSLHARSPSTATLLLMHCTRQLSTQLTAEASLHAPGKSASGPAVLCIQHMSGAGPATARASFSHRRHQGWVDSHPHELPQSAGGSRDASCAAAGPAASCGCAHVACGPAWARQPGGEPHCPMHLAQPWDQGQHLRAHNNIQHILSSTRHSAAGQVVGPQQVWLAQHCARWAAWHRTSSCRCA